MIVRLRRRCDRSLAAKPKAKHKNADALSDLSRLEERVVCWIAADLPSAWDNLGKTRIQT